MPNTISSYLVETRSIRNLLSMLFALVVADGLITNFLIAQGLGRELNPFLHILMLQGNFLTLKVVGALLSIFILWYIYKRRPHISTIIIVGSVFVYTGIVYWNIFAYFLAIA